MASAQLKHQDVALRAKEKPSTQFALKIKRNLWVLYDLGKGLALGEEAVAVRSGCPPLHSIWRVGPVVATRYMRICRLGHCCPDAAGRAGGRTDEVADGDRELSGRDLGAALRKLLRGLPTTAEVARWAASPCSLGGRSVSSFAFCVSGHGGGEPGSTGHGRRAHSLAVWLPNQTHLAPANHAGRRESARWLES